MRIELHCHSHHSDGSLPPGKVAQNAAATGVELFCLTDHDTCAGHQDTVEHFPLGLRGVELSCVENERTVHLLIYERPGSTRFAAVLETLDEQRRVRRDRVRRIAERLADLGVPIDADDLLARVDGSVGRPHIAEELMRRGHVRDRGEAFTRFLHDGGPADVQVSRLRLGEGLEIARAAGAATSLAHPHVYGQAIADMLRAGVDQGLEGLEVYYGLYSSKQRARYRDLAASHDLVETGGSDFHGQQMPQVLRPGVEVPESVGQRLKRWLAIVE